MASISEVNASTIPRGDLKHLHMVDATPTIAFQKDPRFAYTLYIPDSHYPPSQTYHESSKMPLMVIVHGGKANHTTYRDAWISFAEQEGVAIFAPLFPVGISDPWNVDAYRFLGAAPKRVRSEAKRNTNGVHKEKGLRYNEILLSMLEEVAARWPGIEINQFFLGGFSGGGQFSHRFLYLHPERILGICIGAPGFATMCDPSMPWPCGIGGMEDIFKRKIDIEAIRRVPILIACGEEDTGKDTFLVRDHIHGKMPGLGFGECGAGLRTDNARMLAKSLQENGIDVKLEFVPGAGHEMLKVQPAMARFLAPLVQRRVAEQRGQ